LDSTDDTAEDTERPEAVAAAAIECGDEHFLSSLSRYRMRDLASWIFSRHRALVSSLETWSMR
jgi:hypothetical protein